MKQLATKIVILATIVIWIGYDIWTYEVHGNPSTISVVLSQWGNTFPGFEILFGILIGHLFFNQTSSDINEKP